MAKADVGDVVRIETAVRGTHGWVGTIIGKPAIALVLIRLTDRSLEEVFLIETTVLATHKEVCEWAKGRKK